MLTQIGQFHFLRPEWFLAIIPLVVLLIWIFRLSAKSNAWSRVCDEHLLPHLLVGSQQQQSYWPKILVCLAGLLAIFCLAGPTWIKQEIPVYRANEARVIVMNLSPSMYAQDLTPSRIARARFKVLDLLQHFKEGQTAMVVFSGEPFVVSPLTQDSNTIASMVPKLDPNIMPISGDNVASALTLTENLMRQGGATKGQVILVTDSAGSAKAITAAEKLNADGFKISVLGVGTAKGAPIPLARGGFLTNNQGGIEMPKLAIAKLEKLAAAGGGRYVTITNNNNDVDTLLKTAQINRLDGKIAKSSQMTVRWQDEGHWFILLLLPLILLGFRRGIF